MKKFNSFGFWTRDRKKKTAYYRRFGRSGWILGVIGTLLISFALVFVGVEVAGEAISPNSPSAAETRENETLHLTVPAMKRVNNIPVYTAAADDDEKLNASAIHLKDTGLPWEKEPNVYIAGHRLGYPRTGSFLVFYDLHKLRDGNRVVLEDAQGKRYIYRVFRKFTVKPSAAEVTEPVEGKNIVSLQACTLPDYSRRLIVQAELVKVREAPARTEKIRKGPARQQRMQEAPARRQPAQARPAWRNRPHASDPRHGPRVPGDRSRPSPRNPARDRAPGA